MSTVGRYLAEVRISLAISDSDFEAAQTVLAESIPGIAPDAVPRTEFGQQMYNVTVALAYDDDDQVVGAALTCRAQIAVQSMMLRGDPFGFKDVLDKHSELDLLAVRPAERGKGVGGALLEFLEAHLIAAGVQVWFGNATSELDVASLRRFYERHGFTVSAREFLLPRYSESRGSGQFRLRQRSTFTRPSGPRQTLWSASKPRRLRSRLFRHSHRR